MGDAMDALEQRGGPERERETLERIQHFHHRSRARRVGRVRVEAAPELRAEDTSADAGTVQPEVRMSEQSERAIRALNILLAAGALLLLSPLLALIALAVKLTSRGPILYTQVRVGVDRRDQIERRARADRRSGAERRVGFDRRGRPADRRMALSRRARLVRAAVGRRTADVGGHAFRIYKFRSMCVDAECGSGAVWATRNDPRVTALGRILRKSRLDELPQLYNVLKGEMNIVGPRPERPSIFCRLREEIPHYPLRQRARPGITGWAQVKHTYDTCVDDVRKKVGFDLEYLRRRSLWVDLLIMARTIPVMLFKRGAG